MYEAIFINRSVQYHKDMKYHVIDDETNYSAKSIEHLIMIMSADGALSGNSDDDYSNSFSVTFLNNRTIVGVGMLIDENIFRILFNEGSLQDYDASGNLLQDWEIENN